MSCLILFCFSLYKYLTGLFWHSKVITASVFAGVILLHPLSLDYLLSMNSIVSACCYYHEPHYSLAPVPVIHPIFLVWFIIFLFMKSFYQLLEADTWSKLLSFCFSQRLNISYKWFHESMFFILERKEG